MTLLYTVRHSISNPSTWDSYGKIEPKKLYANISKCDFGADSVEYVGHHHTSTKVSADPQMIIVIREWPISKTKSEVQSFLGSVNYYRRYNRTCSKTAKSLTVLKSRAPSKWAMEQTKPFKPLKEAIWSASVLKPFGPKLPTFIVSDATKYVMSWSRYKKSRITFYRSCSHLWTNQSRTTLLTK